MTAQIVTAKELTQAELLELRQTFPWARRADGVTAFVPDLEYDPGLPVRIYTVEFDIGGAEKCVGIQAAPAPHQTPSVDELVLVAEAVLTTGCTPFAPSEDHEQASDLAQELRDLTGREIYPCVGDIGPGLYEDLPDGSTSIVVEFESWPELFAYLHGWIEGSDGS